MNILQSILPYWFKQRLPAIYQWMVQPYEQQTQIFVQLIRQAQSTIWGKQYTYHKIKNINTFKQIVPIQDYESLKPYITRMLKGESNILYPNTIKWFAKSSGTTSDKSKYIPVSQAALYSNHFRGARDIMALYCLHFPDNQLYSGKGFVLGGSHQLHQLQSQIRVGDLSAVLMQNTPTIGRLFRSPPLSIALMDNWEQKLEQMTQIALQQNITHLAGVPTWTILLIKQILARTGETDIRTIWPNLELYIHGGVSFTPYQSQFNAFTRNEKIRYLETYNASEGFFAIQEHPARNDMLLLVGHGIFYEFMPLEELEKSHPKTLQLNEVEVNTHYALIISTNAGLWRYQVGDTIQFTSLLPYRIRVTGRIKHFINAFGEELMVHNTDRAVADTCQQMNCQIKEYTVAPLHFSKKHIGTHEWLIEFEQLPLDINLFTQLLDKNLQKLNSDYEAKRFQDLAMCLPKIQVLPPNTFYKWLKSKGKLGGQHKVPRLANHRKYIDDIKFFVGI